MSDFTRATLILLLKCILVSVFLSEVCRTLYNSSSCHVAASLMTCRADARLFASSVIVLCSCRLFHLQCCILPLGNLYPSSSAESCLGNPMFKINVFLLQ